MERFPEENSPVLPAVESKEGRNRLYFRMEVQVKLVERFASSHFRRFGDELVLVWIERYSEAFGKLFEEHSELIGEYEKDSDAALSKIELFLYGPRDDQEAA